MYSQVSPGSILLFGNTAHVFSRISSPEQYRCHRFLWLVFCVVIISIIVINVFSSRVGSVLFDNAAGFIGLLGIDLDNHTANSGKYILWRIKISDD
jgi:hypothetical protein